MTVSLPTNDLLDRLLAIASERRLDYRLTGEAELDSLFFGRLPFQREGKLALPKLPWLEPRGS